MLCCLVLVRFPSAEQRPSEGGVQERERDQLFNIQILYLVWLLTKAAIGIHSYHRESCSATRRPTDPRARSVLRSPQLTLAKRAMPNATTPEHAGTVHLLVCAGSAVIKINIIRNEASRESYVYNINPFGT